MIANLPQASINVKDVVLVNTPSPTATGWEIVVVVRHYDNPVVLTYDESSLSASDHKKLEGMTTFQDAGRAGAIHGKALQDFHDLIGTFNEAHYV